MPKLHLVGITPDNRGLLLSEHSRSKRGDLVLEIDEKLLDAIDRAHRQLLKEEGRGLESAALPSKRDDREDAPGARLTPREIQHRLRLGESVAGLAKASGTDEAWIDRFAAPVLAEQARLVDRATKKLYTKPRVGPSAVPLAQAVAANVFDKGAALTLDEIDEGWGAHMRPEGVWCVTFSFSHRGRRHLAEWDVDPSTSELTARNKLAGELGYRESGRPMRQPEANALAPAAKKPAARPAPAKKTVVKKPAVPKAAGKPAVGKPRAGARPVPQTLPGTSTETPPASRGGSAATAAGPATPGAGSGSPAPPTPASSPPAEPKPSGSTAPPAPAMGAAPEPATDAPGRTEPSASGPAASAAGPSRAEGVRDPLGRRALFSPPAAEAGSPAATARKLPAAKKVSPVKKTALAKKAAPAKKSESAEKAAPPVQKAAPPVDEAAPPIAPPAPPVGSPAPPVQPPASPTEPAGPPVGSPAPPVQPSASPTEPAGPPVGSPAPPGSPSMPASDERPGPPSVGPDDVSLPSQAPVPEPPAG